MPARVVLRLTSSNLSLNVIAAALHASKVSVSDALRAAAERDVAWKEMERMSAGEVYARLSPDWDAVHAELAKVGATFRFLHGEYREDAPLGARRPCPTAAFASGTGSSRSAGRL